MKRKIEIEESEARILYKIADSTWKKVLENTFGKEFFSDKLINRIKTINDVYKELGRRMPTISDYSFLPLYQQEYSLNLQYITDISELFNEGWVTDWINYNQYKYYSYFKKVGGVWSFYICICDINFAYRPAGFYFEKKENAEYCGKQFLKIYSKILDKFLK
jgi:hypothetical protein